MCQSMVNIQSPTAEIRRGKKEEERRDSMKILWSALLHRATIITTNRKSYTGFLTSHQPRFYAAPNFLIMGIKVHRLVVFWMTSTMKDEKSAAKFHYIKTVSGKL